MSDAKNIQPDEIANRVRERVARIMRLAAMDATRQLLMQHPVDTGYSRSQWRISQNEIDKSVDSPPTPVERTSRKDQKGWYPFKPPNLSELNSVTPDDTIFITNSVGYVRFLEEGSSKQAPAHFIKGIAQAINSRFGRYIREAAK
jgi:hypothetical protein